MNEEIEASVGGDEGVHASEEHGITAREQRAGESLAMRLARELPDGEELRPIRRIQEPTGTPREPGWNVIVTVRGEHFRDAIDILEPYGSVAPTRFYNVLTMRVDDVDSILDRLAELFERDARARDAISRVLPLHRTFTFRSTEEFERAVAGAVAEWIDDLAGARFHVRIHRRGAEELLDVGDEEALVGDVVLAALEEAGAPGRIAFDDVDAVIDIETLDDAAGMSMWSRDDLTDYPFLRVS